MWNTFNLKEIEDYVYLYNMQDVLTSLVVAMDFMKKMSANFYLSSLKFVTPASLSWNFTLNIIKIEPELLTDVIMVLDYKTNIMG